MDCQAAQNELLSAESLNLLAPELSAHLAECPECQELLAKLRKLDAETRALPVPEGYEQPSPEFLRTIAAAAARSGKAANRFLRRAIAAAVVLAFMLAAISLIFFNGSTVQADVLIGDLVDWNLSIAHVHDASGRTRVYQQQLEQLQNLLNKSKLAPGDAALAHTLMSNAQWLTTEDNTSAESQRFQAIANELLIRRQAASDAAGEHLQQIYQQLINQGVNAGSGSATSPAATPRNSTPAETAPSSMLPGNLTLAPLALKTTPATVGTPSGNPMAEPGIHEGWSTAFFGGEDNLALSASRLSGASDAGAPHVDIAHWHHSISHSSGSDSAATNNDSSHSDTTTANTTTAQLPSRSITDTQTHPAETSQAPAQSPPPPQPPPSYQADSNPPPKTWNNQAPPDLGTIPERDPSTRLAALQDMMGWQPVISPGHFSLLFNLDSPTASDEMTDPPPLLLLDGIGLSRREIDLSLAEHIRDSWEGETEWSSTTPPPIGLGNRDFGHADDFGHPIEFPEPTITGFMLLLPLAVRRRRRQK